jgi:hypothetical protein
VAGNVVVRHVQEVRLHPRRAAEPLLHLRCFRNPHSHATIMAERVQQYFDSGGGAPTSSWSLALVIREGPEAAREAQPSTFRIAHEPPPAKRNRQTKIPLEAVDRGKPVDF